VEDQCWNGLQRTADHVRRRRGKQYVAILSGLSNITKRRHDLTPELREQRNQTMLFVFWL